MGVRGVACRLSVAGCLVGTVGICSQLLDWWPGLVEKPVHEQNLYPSVHGGEELAVVNSFFSFLFFFIIVKYNNIK